MSFIIWSLALALSIFSLAQALNIFTNTVCRQKAWLRGAEIKTAQFLSHPKAESSKIAGCPWRITSGANQFLIQNLAEKKSSVFVLSIRGKI
jgi:hypothetical protein